MAEMQKDRVPPGGESSNDRGDDLLPMDCRFVEEVLSTEGLEVKAVVSL